MPVVAVAFYQWDLSREKVIFSSHPPKDHLCFVFNLEGRGQIAACGENDVKAKDLPPGSYVFGSHGSTIVYLPKQKIKIIELQVIPEQLLDSSNRTAFAKELHKLLSPDKDGPAQRAINLITPNMKVVLQQMIGFHKNYPLQEFFCASKVLELLSYVFGRLPGKRNGIDAKPSSYSAHICTAQEILETEMNKPPSLADLAKRVGMSTPHFKRVFRQLTGLTPYGFLRQKRMEFSLSLLANTAKNISEIAHLSGYKSESHFTRAFTDYFGANPSSFQKE
ncbi:MAG: Regulatory protein PchR [Syntrophorhabdaceae bacterium PtaU1.Bin034]|nr:MAG: Regulatory protein PchR [Syntrophorhabdaceae bacterium PtaU1.Bin034]